jgi:hypothetical protein
MRILANVAILGTKIGAVNLTGRLGTEAELKSIPPADPCSIGNMEPSSLVARVPPALTQYRLADLAQVQTHGIESKLIQKSWGELDSNLVFYGWERTGNLYNELLTSSLFDWQLTTSECPNIEVFHGARLTLGNAMSEGVFEASVDNISSSELPERVMIKYFRTCGEHFDDPLFKEYIIMKILDGAKLASKVYALSAPGSSPPDCYVRAMIMDPEGPSLADLMARLSYQQIIQLGKMTIDKLSTLHDEGFVHGNILPINVHLAGSEIHFSDFSHSKYFPNEIGTTTVTGSISAASSHWELRGERFGRRDDVFRAIEMTAALLSGDPESYYEILSKLPENEFIEYKASTLFFSEEHLGAIVCSDNVACQTALHKLNTALSKVRMITHVDARPDYHAIGTLFRK